MGIINSRLEIIDRISAPVALLDSGCKRKLAGMLVDFHLAKNEILLKEGQICSYIWYVEKGIIRLFYNKRGRDLTEHFSYEGGIFLSLESYFRQTPSKLIIEALEPTTVYGIPYKPFRELMSAEPAVAHFYGKILENCLIDSQQKPMSAGLKRPVNVIIGC